MAFIAFTTPSVLLLLVFARLLPVLDHSLGQAAIHGLKLLAVAVVAQGVLGMVQKLTPDMPRRLIATITAAVVVVSGTALVQLFVIAVGAVLGLWFCRTAEIPAAATLALRYAHRTGLLLLVVFTVLLAMALAPAEIASPLASVAAAFYRAGALVFGGGHVMLPLLQEAVVEPGWVGNDEFLAGYGAAQAVPGPMFSLAAFLGARLDGGQSGVIGALISVIAILLPGLLLVAGALPWWHSIARQPSAARALADVNAAVVGLLAAALYDPVWTSAVLSAPDFAIALIGFVLLAATRTSSLLVAGWCVAAAMLRAVVT